MPLSWPQTPRIRKPQTQFSHQHCSRGPASEGNSCPALIWFIHMQLLQGRPFITVFSREEQTHKISKVIEENRGRNCIMKTVTKCPTSSCQYLWFCNQFSLFSSPTCPLPLLTKLYSIYKTWLIDSLSDFKAKKLL